MAVVVVGEGEGFVHFSFRLFYFSLEGKMVGK